MDIRYAKKSLKKFLDALPKKVKIEKIILYGSAVRKQAKYANDIDVLIVSDSFRKWDEDKRLDTLYKASRFIEPEIHPWGVTINEWKSASKYSLIGQARINGISII